MKVGLYSITYLGIWYDGPALTVKEFIQRAKELGADGVELDAKRPHANPMDLDQRARDEIREQCEKLGLAMPSLAANNDFSSPVPEHRECQLLMVKEQARLAADLGARSLRLFGAWTGVTFRDGVSWYREARNGWNRAFPDVPSMLRFQYVEDCLREAAAFGEEFGVIMSLQNHPPLLRNYKDVLKLVRAVDSPWLRVNLDCPMLVSQDDDWVRNAALDTGSLQTHSHFGGEFGRDENGAAQLKAMNYDPNWNAPNYPVFLQAMKDIGYDGYYCFEFCHPAVDESNRSLGIDYIDEQAALSMEYMRDRIAEVGG